MIAPMNSLGSGTVARTTGSRTSETLPSGNSLGLVTSTDSTLERHVVLHVRQRRDEVEVELALQPLADDLEVQHPEEAHAETEPEGRRRLRFVDQCGVVELEPVQRVAQVGVVGPVDRVQPGEHHRLGVAVATERAAAGFAALVTVSPTRLWRTSFTPVMRYPTSPTPRPSTAPVPGR